MFCRSYIIYFFNSFYLEQLSWSRFDGAWEQGNQGKQCLHVALKYIFFALV